MNTTLKRILCIILVISLMMTMTGCAEAASGLVYAAGFLIQTGIRIVGYFVLIGVMWVVDQVTWPFVEYTGFNVNALGNKIAQRFTELVQPDALMENGWWGGWFVIRDEEELEAKLRKGGHLKDGETLEDMVLKEVFGDDIPENLFGTESTEETGETEEETVPEETGAVEEETAPEESTAGEQDKLYADSTVPTETFQFESSGTIYTDPVIIYTADKALTDVYNMPQPQPITGDDVITKDVPVRPGYHFMGWARVYAEEDVLDGQKQPVPENETPQQKAEREKAEQEALERYQESINEPRYFPGQQVDEKNPFQQTTTLYAVWKEHDIDAPSYYLNTAGPDHYYTVQHVKSDGKPTGKVAITCSCGMTITDRDMPEKDFLTYCQNMKKPMSTADASRLYKLYKGQDIGPLALQLNTMAYDENILFEQIDLGVVEINKGEVRQEPNFGVLYQHLTDICKKMKTVTPIVEKYMVKISTSAEEKQMVQDMIREVAMGKRMDYAAKTFSTLRLLVESKKMLDSERGILQQTMSMLEVIEAIASFTHFGKAVEEVSEVLQEGLKLIGKCEKTRDKYQNALRLAAADGNKELGKPTITAYLEDIMGDQRIAQAYQELVLTGTPGCTCGSSSTCNFDATGMCLKYFPDVATVIWRIQNSSMEPTPLEKSFLALYLAERSRHELYEKTGLTLAQYVKLLK